MAFSREKQWNFVQLEKAFVHDARLWRDQLSRRILANKILFNVENVSTAKPDKLAYGFGGATTVVLLLRFPFPLADDLRENSYPFSPFADMPTKTKP